jgi:uncharacterized membrane protein YphA (DoxX/SURF4 family)
MTIYTLFGLIGSIALVVNIIRYFIEKPAKPLIAFIQDFVGVLFIFSGFVKAIDPLGTAYKMTEYFHEFNMMFMDNYSLAFAVFMIVFELVLGVALLLGYKKDLSIWLSLLMIVFFTFLTGFTAYTGKVTDCGCFGDFIKLKPIQSFYKDVFLTALILILLFGKKHIEPLISKFPSALILGVVTIVSTWYCFSNFYFNLPQFDFRPYKIGNHIPEQMTVPDSLKPIKDFIFVYKNKATGELKDYKTDELGNVNFDEWEYADRKEIVIREGEVPKINNFRLDNENGENISEEVLNDPNYAFWIIAYDLTKTNKTAFTDKLNTIAAEAKKNGYKVFVATATADYAALKKELNADYTFYTGDAIFLKTIIRSNPGLVIVKNGTVKAKYHHRHIPDYGTIRSTVLK